MSSRKRKGLLPIKIIKFKNGECVISQILINKNDTIVLKDPLQMVHLPKLDENGQLLNTEMALRDWIEGTIITQFTIGVDTILLITDCQIALQLIYSQAVSAMTQKDRENRESINKDIENIKRKPSSNKRGGLTGGIPDIERFRDGEDETDGGWSDIPPPYNN